MPLGGDEDIRRLIRDLGKIPPSLRKSLRPAIRAAAQPIVSDARQRASWSTRIPGAIKVSQTFSGRRAGVRIVVSSRRAPHARAYEGIGGQRVFRHPVFGHDVWVGQQTRPFLIPAVQAHAGTVRTAIAETVDRVVREHGFR